MIPTLSDLVDSKLEQLSSFYLAAQAPCYQRGRDEVPPQLLEVQELLRQSLEYQKQLQEGLVPLRPIDVDAQLERASDLVHQMERETGKGVVIRGSFNQSLIAELLEATSYFLHQARDFKEERGAVRERLISCQLETRQIVIAGNKDLSRYSLSFHGELLNKKFSFHITNDLKAMPGILDHPNDFSYEATGSSSWNVHLNGPAENAVIRDLLKLGEAINNYCLEQLLVPHSKTL